MLGLALNFCRSHQPPRLSQTERYSSQLAQNLRGFADTKAEQVMRAAASADLRKRMERSQSEALQATAAAKSKAKAAAAKAAAAAEAAKTGTELSVGMIVWSCYGTDNDPASGWYRARIDRVRLGRAPLPDPDAPVATLEPTPPPPTLHRWKSCLRAANSSHGQVMPSGALLEWSMSMMGSMSIFPRTNGHHLFAPRICNHLRPQPFAAASDLAQSGDAPEDENSQGSAPNGEMEGGGEEDVYEPDEPEADDESTIAQAELPPKEAAAETRALEEEGEMSVEQKLASYGVTREQLAASDDEDCWSTARFIHRAHTELFRATFARVSLGAQQTMSFIVILVSLLPLILRKNTPNQQPTATRQPPGPDPS